MVQLAAALLTAFTFATPVDSVATVTPFSATHGLLNKVQGPSQAAASAKKTASKTPVRATRKRAYSASAARARRARLATARATARARDWSEAQIPRFILDALGNEVPDVRAAAAIIYNPETNEVLWESHAQDQRSIASITKVMTALVFLESGAELTTPATVQRADVTRASTTYLRAGYQVTAEDLLNLLLIGSDNAAARMLARISPYGTEGFINQMNHKAIGLGLPSTRYTDPSGLLADNVSSAYDMARLIAYASADERIGVIMRKASHTVYAGKRTINVNSTNQILKSGDIEVMGGKTGFINRSGYCLATMLRLPRSGKQVAVVVLGAQSNAGRFWETRHLFNWLGTQTQRLLVAAPLPQQQQN
ncbi:MAG: D-alanyl-D-alanine carboxypeptidase family protein [Vicinamibacterales bacterium]